MIDVKLRVGVSSSIIVVSFLSCIYMRLEHALKFADTIATPRPHNIRRGNLNFARSESESLSHGSILCSDEKSLLIVQKMT